MKAALKKRILIILISVIGAYALSFALTWMFGVRQVRNLHEAELRLFYEKLHKAYEENSTIAKGWVDYHVIFPFLIESRHETRVCGYNEYHLWYVFGVRLLHRRWRWIS